MSVNTVTVYRWNDGEKINVIAEAWEDEPGEGIVKDFCWCKKKKDAIAWAKVHYPNARVLYATDVRRVK